MAGAAQMVIHQTWLSEILFSLEGLEVVCGDICSLSATGVSLDSRTIQPGEIFVALSGAASHGAKYAKDAVRKGAAAVITSSDEGPGLAEKIGRLVPVITVGDPRTAAARLACAFQGYPCHEFDLVGITGTNGKTTITYLLESILKLAGRYPGVIGTVNCRLGLWSEMTGLTTPDPVTLQKLLRKMADSGAGSVLLEVSSHALDQKRVEGCKFKVAIFTNLTRDHLDYHKNMEQYFQAKANLFTLYKPEFSVINIDDLYGQRLYEGIDGKSLTYGLSKNADIHPVKVDLDISGIETQVQTPVGRLNISSPLIGKHNLSNILAAVAASICLKIEPYTIIKGIADLPSIPGRLERVPSPKGITGLVDYAHTPDALEQVLNELKGLVSGKLVCVIGCGGDRDRGKRPLMGRIAASCADHAFFTSDNPRTENPEDIISEMVEGLAGKAELLSKVEVIPNRREAILSAASFAGKGDCVLVAGKGHEAYQQIGNTKRPFKDAEVLGESFKSLTLDEIVKAVKGVPISGPSTIRFRGICTDSRTVEVGNLFVPITGLNHDGHDFVIESALKGAFGSVVAKERASALKGQINEKGLSDFCLVQVEDTLHALGDLAAYVRQRNGFEVFAITGSCGKTSTKEILYSLLSQQWKCSRTIKNFNNLIGLPLSIFQADLDSDWLVLEMGMNTPGEIARLTEIAGPAAALITNIKPAHLEGLGTIEAIAQEKLSLFQGLGSRALAVVNLDDPFILKMSKELTCQAITYSMSPETGADVECLEWQPAVAGSIATFSFKGRELDVKIPLLGKVAVNNALAASAAAYALGLGLREIKLGLANLKPVNGRLKLLPAQNGRKVLDDTYNANPASMEAALEALEHIASKTPKVAILGDMYELGDQSEALHAEIGAKAALSGLDMLLAVGKNAGFIKKGAESAGFQCDKIKLFSSTDELLAWIKDVGFKHLPENSTILIKGSRAVGLERAADALTAFDGSAGEEG